MLNHRTDCPPTDRSSTRTTRKRVGLILGSLLLLVLCISIRYYWGAQPVRAGTPDNALASASQGTAVSDGDSRPSSRAAAAPSAGSPSSGAQSRTAPAVVADDSSRPAHRGDGQHPADHPRGPYPRMPPSPRQGSAGGPGQQASDRRRVPPAWNQRNAGGSGRRNRASW